MTAAALARPEIATLEAYSAAKQEHLTIRLNANEMPSDAGTAVGDEYNRYPPIRPWQLRDRLANVHCVSPDQLLVTRGSSEAIDLLLRVFCRPALDNVVIAAPTFGMYKVYADIQNATARCVTASDDLDFAPDVPALLRACDGRSKLLFICSPNNPTGRSVAQADLERLLRERRDESLVVVDEAYIEFSSKPSFVRLLTQYDNLVVLRTLSKAFGLAGARVGLVIARPAVIALLDSVLAPYAIATPIIELALAALTSDALSSSATRISSLLAERQRLEMALSVCDDVEKTWPSDANFLLVRFRDPARVSNRLAKHRILIRDFSGEPGLQDCARITVGSPEENDLLLAALTSGAA